MSVKKSYEIAKWVWDQPIAWEVAGTLYPYVAPYVVSSGKYVFSYAKMVQAIENNDVVQVKALIEQGFPVPSHGLDNVWGPGLSELAITLLPHVTTIGALPPEQFDKQAYAQTIFNHALNENDIKAMKTILDSQYEINITAQSLSDFGYIGFGGEEFGPDIDVFKFLLDNGVDVNEVQVQKIYNSEDQFLLPSPLYNAVSYGDPEIVKLYLDYGAEVNCVHGMGFTPLMGAVAASYLEISGHIFCHGPSLDIINILIEHGADLNAISDHNGSALHMAIDNAYNDGAMLLVESGIDITLLDEKGRSALDIAVEKDNTSMQEYLVNQYELQGIELDHNPLMTDTGATVLSIDEIITQPDANQISLEAELLDAVALVGNETIPTIDNSVMIQPQDSVLEALELPAQLITEF